MATVFPELPGWRFTVTERSASVYEVVAHRDRGGSVTLSGVDYDAVLEQALMTLLLWSPARLPKRPARCLLIRLARKSLERTHA